MVNQNRYVWEQLVHYRDWSCDYHIVSCDLQVYEERVFTVAVNCARIAAKSGVKKFVHVSTAQVYNCSKVISSIHTLTLTSPSHTHTHVHTLTP